MECDEQKMNFVKIFVGVDNEHRKVKKGDFFLEERCK